MSPNPLRSIPATALALALAASAAAQFNSHLGISVGSDGDLVTERWQSGTGYLGAERVFAFNGIDDGAGGLFFDVGTNSVGGTFAYPGEIGFDFMSPLGVWDGDHFDLVASTVTFQFGPITATSGSGVVPGYGTLVRDPNTHPTNPAQWGRHHTHQNVFMSAGTAPGVYLMEFVLWYEPGNGNPTTYGDSLPFWMLFNYGGSVEEVVAATAWVQTNLVPAPGAIALLGAAGLLGRRRRRD